MKSAHLAFAALATALAATPARADYIETRPYHASIEPDRVGAAVLTTHDKSMPPVPVLHEQGCVMLAFGAALVGRPASVTCLSAAGGVASIFLCRPQRNGDENTDRDTPTCLRYRP